MKVAEQIVSVILQVCKGSKLWIHRNLWLPEYLFTYSFKFIYFIVYLWSLKNNFVKENKKPFKAIKSTTKHKNLSQIYILGRL